MVFRSAGSQAGPTTRAAAQRLLAENQKLGGEGLLAQAGSATARAAPLGKRSDECEAMGGGKKGRAAFGDLTNVEGSGAPAQRGPADKGAEAAAKGLPAHQCRRQSAQGLPPRHKRPSGAQALLEDAEQGSMEVEGEAAPLGYVDLDAKDAADIKASVPYAEDVVDTLLQSEVRRRPSPAYLSARGQAEITANMRCVLVDWLVEVAQEFKLTSDTLYLAIAYIDRYLSLQHVPRSRLQLLGVSCMLVASKFEEIYAPQVQEFRYITDNSYSRGEILEMEESVLHVLNFEVVATTPRHFLRRFIRAALAESSVAPDPRLEYLAAYICELALPEYSMLAWLPSQLAAAAVMLARLTLSGEAWSPTLRHYTRMGAPSLQGPATALHALHVRAASPQTCAVPAILEKYSNPRYKCVARLAPPPYLPAWLFREDRPAGPVPLVLRQHHHPPPPGPAAPLGPLTYQHQNPIFGVSAPPMLPELSLSTSCEMSPGTSYAESPAMS